MTEVQRSTYPVRLERLGREPFGASQRRPHMGQSSLTARMQPHMGKQSPTQHKHQILEGQIHDVGTYKSYIRRHLDILVPGLAFIFRPCGACGLS